MSSPADLGVEQARHQLAVLRAGDVGNESHLPAYLLDADVPSPMTSLRAVGLAFTYPVDPTETTVRCSRVDPSFSVRVWVPDFTPVSPDTLKRDAACLALET